MLIYSPFYPSRIYRRQGDLPPFVFMNAMHDERLGGESPLWTVVNGTVSPSSPVIRALRVIYDKYRGKGEMI